MNFPFAKRPHLGIIDTAFEFETVGAQPAGWVKETQAADFTALVQTEATSLFGNALKMIRTPSSNQLLVWHDILPCADVEILYRAKKLENSEDNRALMGAAFRAQLPTTGSTVTLASAILLEGHEDWLGKWVSGSMTGFAQYGGEHVGTGTGNWWWQRSRCIGNTLMTKHWVQGSAEPAFQPTADMGTGIPATGYVGLFVNNFIDGMVDYFAVSIGSPGNPPTTIPLPVFAS